MRGFRGDSSTCLRIEEHEVKIRILSTYAGLQSSLVSEYYASRCESRSGIKVMIHIVQQSELLDLVRSQNVAKIDELEARFG